MSTLPAHSSAPAGPAAPSQAPATAEALFHSLPRELQAVLIRYAHNDRLLQERAAPILRDMAMGHLQSSQGEAFETFCNEYPRLADRQNFIETQRRNTVYAGVIEAMALAERLQVNLEMAQYDHETPTGAPSTVFPKPGGNDELPLSVIVKFAGSVRSGHWFAEEYAGTLTDGNCLYNAFALKLREICAEPINQVWQAAGSHRQPRPDRSPAQLSHGSRRADSAIDSSPRTSREGLAARSPSASYTPVAHSPRSQSVVSSPAHGRFQARPGDSRRSSGDQKFPYTFQTCSATSSPMSSRPQEIRRHIPEAQEIFRLQNIELTFWNQQKAVRPRSSASAMKPEEDAALLHQRALKSLQLQNPRQYAMVAHRIAKDKALALRLARGELQAAHRESVRIPRAPQNPSVFGSPAAMWAGSSPDAPRNRAMQAAAGRRLAARAAYSSAPAPRPMVAAAAS